METETSKPELYDPFVAMGKPLYCNIDKILDGIEEYILCDELEMALFLLDNLPSWYRDNVPKRAYDIKKQLYKNIMTIEDYLKVEDEVSWDEEKTLNYYKHPAQHRGRRVAYDLIKKLNEQGITPQIVEFAPAMLWLPLGLDSDNLKFTYYPITISQQVKEKAKTWKDKVHLVDKIDPAQFQIFICFETIEHMWRPDDILHYFYKYDLNPQRILFSTPQFTCFGGLPDWKTRELGHVRTWSKTELHAWLNKGFPGYVWGLHDMPQMVFEGTKCE
jgi:hypothetical protein